MTDYDSLVAHLKARANGRDTSCALTDLCRASADAIEELRKDAARLDLLEAAANESGGLHLHDGFNNKHHCLGLGLKRLGRSLRQAIDQSLAASPAAETEKPKA